MSKLAGRSVLFAALAVPIAILAGPLTASAETADVPPADQVTVGADATTSRGSEGCCAGDDVDVNVDTTVNGIHHNNDDTDLNVDVHDHGYDGFATFADYQPLKPAPAAVADTQDQYADTEAVDTEAVDTEAVADVPQVAPQVAPEAAEVPAVAGLVGPRDGGPSLDIEWYDAQGAVAGAAVDGAAGGSAEGGSVAVGRDDHPDQQGDQQGQPQDQQQGQPQGEQYGPQQAEQHGQPQGQPQGQQFGNGHGQHGGGHGQHGGGHGGDLEATWFDGFGAYAGIGGAWGGGGEGGMISVG